MFVFSVVKFIFSLQYCVIRKLLYTIRDSPVKYCKTLQVLNFKSTFNVLAVTFDHSEHDERGVVRHLFGRIDHVKFDQNVLQIRYV